MPNQANFLQSLGWALLNSLWQLALLWIIYQLITAVYRSARPSAKSMLASTLLMSGFAWFVYTFFIVYDNGNGHGPAVPYFNGYENEEVYNWLASTLPATSVIYLLLLFLPLLRFIRNYRYVQVIRRYGLSKPDAEWKLFVTKVAERMGIKKPVHLWVSEWVTSPVTIGYLKPVILVPLAALNNLNTQQMEAVLLHELSHIRRYDYLLNLILNIIRTILYFNPFAKAFVKIVETEREKSCDEMVLQFQYDSHEYASALLTLEKASAAYQLLLLGAAGNGRQLMNRIENILGVQQRKKNSLRRYTAVLAAVFCIISVNTIFVLGKAISSKAASHQRNIAASPLAAMSVDNRAYLTERPARSFNVDLIPAPANNTGDGNSAQTAVTDLAANPVIINASFDAEPVVELDKVEEAVIKEAVASSRKILESTQWKTIEKNLADVFSKREKEELKNALRDEMGKFDWGQWENKLRLAYDKVDWEKVNNQLYEAMNKMKMDSLVKVYNEAMVNLNLAQKELKGLSLTGIPDSDITLKSLADKQRQLQREVNRLKSTKNKKIVHL